LFLKIVKKTKSRGSVEDGIANYNVGKNPFTTGVRLAISDARSDLNRPEKSSALLRNEQAVGSVGIFFAI